MKKVAILTQPLHTNYGGTLQAYALQSVISKMGCNVTTIDYQSSNKGIIRLILSIVKSHLLKRAEKYPFFVKEKHIKESHHMKFIHANIKRSEVICSEEALSKHFKASKYDTVVVGSDQVWRVEYSPNIDNFFLNFIDGSIQKISYAASFGLDKWQFSPAKTEQIKSWLNQFDAISVREDSALGLCKEYLDIDVKHVLDPTLLLEKQDYLNLIENMPVDNDHIFTYILDETSEKGKIVDKISTRLGLSTFKKQPKKIYKTSLFVEDHDNYIYPKIEEWLCAFRDSKFIVTDSFHGTVFSIIFNKPFVAIANSDRGIARFSSLLKIFNLESRLISSIDQLKDELILSKIDFDKVNSILNDERDKSLSFLSHHIDS